MQVSSAANKLPISSNTSLSPLLSIHGDTSYGLGSLDSLTWLPNLFAHNHTEFINDVLLGFWRKACLLLYLMSAMLTAAVFISR